jgi:hypothetical protein
MPGKGSLWRGVGVTYRSVCASRTVYYEMDIPGDPASRAVGMRSILDLHLARVRTFLVAYGLEPEQSEYFAAMSYPWDFVECPDFPSLPNFRQFLNGR